MTTKSVNNNKDLAVILKGTGISLIGKAANAIIQFGFLVLMTRLLGAKAAGIYFLGYAFHQVGLTIGSFALNNTACRYFPIVANPKALASQLFQLLFVISFISFSILMIIVTAVLPALNQNVYPKVYFLFLLAVPFAAWMTLQVGIFLGMKRMLPGTVVQEIFYPSIRLLMFLSLFWMGLRLEAALFAFFISSMLSAVLGWVWLQHDLSLFSGNGKAPLPTKQELLHFSAPIMLAMVINLGITAGMPILISCFASVNEVALFGAASRIIVLFDLAIIAVNGLFAPTISEYLSQGRLTELKVLFRKLTAFVLTLTAPFVAACIFFPKEIMGLFGHEFAQGSSYLTILAIGELMNVATGSVGQFLLMGGHSRLLLALTATANVLAIIVALSTVNIIGSSSFAVGTATGVVCVNLLALIFVWRLQGLHPFDKGMVLLCGLSSLPVFIMHFSFSIWTTMILYIVWTCCILLVGSFQFGEQTFMLAIIKKLKRV